MFIFQEKNQLFSFSRISYINSCHKYPFIYCQTHFYFCGYNYHESCIAQVRVGDRSFSFNQDSNLVESPTASKSKSSTYKIKFFCAFCSLRLMKSHNCPSADMIVSLNSNYVGQGCFFVCIFFPKISKKYTNLFPN